MADLKKIHASKRRLSRPNAVDMGAQVPERRKSGEPTKACKHSDPGSLGSQSAYFFDTMYP